MALCAASVAALLGAGAAARADNFAGVVYEPASGQLVVTMRYRGTNANHNFTLRWGECKPHDLGLPALAAEVLDDQFRDRAQQEFTKTVRFDLSDMPCRPARVSLRTAPRYYTTVTIPR